MTFVNGSEPSPVSETTDVLPVSFGQELLLLLDRAEPGSVTYNVPRTVRLRGRLDVAALRRAFDQLVERHEILRTTYAFHDDHPVQVIHPAAGVAFDIVDLSGSPEPERTAEVERLVRAWIARPFDLTRDFPLRVALVRFDAEDHVLHIDTHHIASDGGSRELLFRDLDLLYTAQVAGTSATLPPLAIQFADFAVWEREQLAGDRLEALLEYWRGELGGAEPNLELRTDFPRSDVVSDEAISEVISLDAADVERLSAFARRHASTLYMVVLAAYQTLLHRYGGAEDILVGSPVAGRRQAETENLIGYFSGMVVQRARFTGDPTVEALLAQVRETCLSAFEHAEMPFERLMMELRRGHAISNTPLQGVFTSIGAAEPAPSRLGALAVQPVGKALQTTKFDLTLFMTAREQGVSLMLRARASLWTRASVQRFLTHLRRLLDAMVADPAQRISQLAMLTPQELQRLGEHDPVPVDLGSDVSAVELFDTAAQRVPDRTAVVADDGTLTFGELRRRANQLAHRLRRCGVEPETCVGIALDRSVDTIVALAGILRAGAAYVPLPPDVPAARRDDIIAQAGIGVVVTVTAHAATLPDTVRSVCFDRDRAALEAEPGEPPDDPVGAGSAAYVLFTSGSTGQPKGVVVTHRNIVHYTRAIARRLGDVAPALPGDGFGALDGLHFASVSTLAADLGNTCIFPALCAGGTLHLISAATSNDPQRYAAYLAEHAIDVLKITPGHLRALLPSDDRAQTARALPKRWLVVGGEALDFDLASNLIDAQACRLLNHYGPTETTVGACTFEVTAATLEAARAAHARTVPIGRPLANTQCRVLDGDGALVPAGVPGELYIAGGGVARGYLGRPDLTAERFVDHPGLGRMYRTGDRVRALDDGSFEFLGRVDGQVKIRGNRVELGEIEAALLLDPAVAQAAVRTWDDPAGAYLAAYVVRSTSAVSTDAALLTTLRHRLAEQLPHYMQPRSIAILDGLPLNANGKLERRSLPQPDVEPAVDARVAPRTESEAEVLQIWADALHRDPSTIGVTDDFLALGGHSLFAIRILGKVNRRFKIRLSLRTLFDAPTIAQLAEVVDLEVQLAALDGMSDDDAARMLAALQPDGLGP